MMQFMSEYHCMKKRAAKACVHPKPAANYPTCKMESNREKGARDMDGMERRQSRIIRLSQRDHAYLCARSQFPSFMFALMCPLMIEVHERQFDIVHPLDVDFEALSDIVRHIETHIRR
jgi:hypothetical protein